MKKLLVAVVLLCSMSFAGNAQGYENAVGLRGGAYNGITFKHSFGQNAIDLLFTTRWSGFTFTALYEWQRELSEPGLSWYYGLGGHAGYYSGNKQPWFGEFGSGPVIGVDGVIGIEYVFSAIPLAISLDYKPAFNLIGWTGYSGDEFGLSFRYYW